MRTLVRDKGFGAVATPVVCPGPGAWVSGRGRRGCVRFGLVRVPFALGFQ